MGFRTLIIVLAIFFVILMVRKLLNRLGTPTTKETQLSVDIVQCSHCGVHIPKPDALVDGVHYYCCEEHRSANHTPDA